MDSTHLFGCISIVIILLTATAAVLGAPMALVGVGMLAAIGTITITILV